MSIPERAATLALSTFEKLPQKCKPRIQADGQREWTPMSAIILAIGNSNNAVLKCVSLATGTKCLAASQVQRCNGLVLHDCHAEVLAFRGLNRWLLNEIKSTLEDSGYVSDIVEPRNTSTNQHCVIDFDPVPFRLCANISIYMFTTTAPCGDASMDLLISAATDATPWSTESVATGLFSADQPLGRGHFSLLGVVRRKPARADAEATMSKSCSDKMALKQFTGLLSFPTDLLVQPDANTFLTGLIVYEDQYDSTGFERAWGPSGRLQKLVAATPSISPSFFSFHALPPMFPRFQFSKAPALRSKVSNISAVYVAGSNDVVAPVYEVLVNGVKQGSKQFEDRPGKASMLCRSKMVETAVEICRLVEMKSGGCDGGGSSGRLIGEGRRRYSEIKVLERRGRKREVKNVVVEGLGGWVTNSVEDDFEINPVIV